jgi:hypothetical protein
MSNPNVLIQLHAYMEQKMKCLKYAVALPITLVSFSASAWDSLTPQEAFDKCYAGDTKACAVAREFRQNQELHSSPYEPNYAPRPWSAADQWVLREDLWQEKPGPFSPGELAR